MLKNEIVNDYYKSLNGNYEDLIKSYINEEPFPNIELKKQKKNSLELVYQKEIEKINNFLDIISLGEMAEWFKAHAWKVCVLSKVPWVRIPLSPPRIDFLFNKLMVKIHYLFKNLQIK